jgi:hypothetical protein
VKPHNTLTQTDSTESNRIEVLKSNRIESELLWGESRTSTGEKGCQEKHTWMKQVKNHISNDGQGGLNLTLTPLLYFLSETYCNARALAKELFSVKQAKKLETGSTDVNLWMQNKLSQHQTYVHNFQHSSTINPQSQPVRMEGS